MLSQAVCLVAATFARTQQKQLSYGSALDISLPFSPVPLLPAALQIHQKIEVIHYMQLTMQYNSLFYKQTFA